MNKKQEKYLTKKEFKEWDKLYTLKEVKHISILYFLVGLILLNAGKSMFAGFTLGFSLFVYIAYLIGLFVMYLDHKKCSYNHNCLNKLKK